MKKILVTVASLAVAFSASFGASAHPFPGDPTPPANPNPRVETNTAPGAVLDIESDVEQEGANEDAETDEPEANQVDQSAGQNDSDDNDVEEQSVDENENEDEADDEVGDEGDD